MTDNEIKNLISEALIAKTFAYVPYSNFRVGAALYGKSGNIYRGCNIENAAYSPTNCAERTAFFKAISDGEKDFLAIAVTGGEHNKKGEYCPPCGVCRQVMVEFCDLDNFLVIFANSVDDYQIFTLKQILPYTF
ncbi:MAG TPA: cytidine deaminase, partial [Clostridia bacterium]|nr:cytidine deaminase [Clostridia bacterium]